MIKAGTKRKYLGSLIFFHLPANTYCHFYQWVWKKWKKHNQFQMYKIQVQVMLSRAEYSTSHSKHQKGLTVIKLFNSLPPVFSHYIKVS
jgi:hypothetical protein